MKKNAEKIIQDNGKLLSVGIKLENTTEVNKILNETINKTVNEMIT